MGRFLYLRKVSSRGWVGSCTLGRSLAEVGQVPVPEEGLQKRLVRFLYLRKVSSRERLGRFLYLRKVSSRGWAGCCIYLRKVSSSGWADSST